MTLQEPSIGRDDREAALPAPRCAGMTGSLHDALAALGAEAGERVTLLQFSSAFCAPCRATRRTLAEVAAVVPGVVHVEVDADEHLRLTRALGIEKTPTTLVLDAEAQEVTRRVGQPRKADVLAALTLALPS